MHKDSEMTRALGDERHDYPGIRWAPPRVLCSKPKALHLQAANRTRNAAK